MADGRHSSADRLLRLAGKISLGLQPFPVDSCAFNPKRQQLLLADRACLKLLSFENEVRRAPVFDRLTPDAQVLYQVFSSHLSNFLIIYKGEHKPSHVESGCLAIFDEDLQMRHCVRLYERETLCAVYDIYGGKLITYGRDYKEDTRTADEKETSAFANTFRMRAGPDNFRVWTIGAEAKGGGALSVTLSRIISGYDKPLSLLSVDSSHDILVGTSTTWENVWVWRLSTGELRNVYENFTGGVITGVFFLPRQHRVLTTHADSKLRIWEWQDESANVNGVPPPSSLHRKHETSHGELTTAAVGDPSTLPGIFTAGKDGKLVYWDTDRWEAIGSVELSSYLFQDSRKASIREALVNSRSSPRTPEAGITRQEAPLGSLAQKSPDEIGTLTPCVAKHVLLGTLSGPSKFGPVLLVLSRETVFVFYARSNSRPLGVVPSLKCLNILRPAEGSDSARAVALTHQNELKFLFINHSQKVNTASKVSDSNSLLSPSSGSTPRAIQEDVSVQLPEVTRLSKTLKDMEEKYPKVLKAGTFTTSSGEVVSTTGGPAGFKILAASTLELLPSVSSAQQKPAVTVVTSNSKHSCFLLGWSDGTLDVLEVDTMGVICRLHHPDIVSGISALALLPPEAAADSQEADAVVQSNAPKEELATPWGGKLKRSSKQETGVTSIVPSALFDHSVIAGSVDGSLYLWKFYRDSISPQLVKCWHAHVGPVQSLHYAKFSRFISASTRVPAGSTGENSSVHLAPRAFSVSTVSVSQLQRQLVLSAGEDSKVAFYSPVNYKVLGSLSDEKDTFTTIEIIPHWSIVICGHSSGRLSARQFSDMDISRFDGPPDVDQRQHSQLVNRITQQRDTKDPGGIRSQSASISDVKIVSAADDGMVVVWLLSFRPFSLSSISAASMSASVHPTAKVSMTPVRFLSFEGTIPYSAFIAPDTLLLLRENSQLELTDGEVALAAIAIQMVQHSARMLLRSPVGTAREEKERRESPRSTVRGASNAAGPTKPGSATYREEIPDGAKNRKAVKALEEGFEVAPESAPAVSFVLSGKAVGEVKMTKAELFRQKVSPFIQKQTGCVASKSLPSFLNAWEPAHGLPEEEVREWLDMVGVQVNVLQSLSLDRVEMIATHFSELVKSIRDEIEAKEIAMSGHAGDVEDKTVGLPQIEKTFKPYAEMNKTRTITRYNSQGEPVYVTLPISVQGGGPPNSSTETLSTPAPLSPTLQKRKLKREHRESQKEQIGIRQGTSKQLAISANLMPRADIPDSLTGFFGAGVDPDNFRVQKVLARVCVCGCPFAPDSYYCPKCEKDRPEEDLIESSVLQLDVVIKFIHQAFNQIAEDDIKDRLRRKYQQTHIQRGEGFGEKEGSSGDTETPSQHSLLTSFASIICQTVMHRYGEKKVAQRKLIQIMDSVVMYDDVSVCYAFGSFIGLFKRLEVDDSSLRLYVALRRFFQEKDLVLDGDLYRHFASLVGKGDLKRKAVPIKNIEIALKSVAKDISTWSATLSPLVLANIREKLPHFPRCHLDNANLEAALGGECVDMEDFLLSFLAELVFVTKDAQEARAVLFDLSVIGETNGLTMAPPSPSSPFSGIGEPLTSETDSSQELEQRKQALVLRLQNFLDVCIEHDKERFGCLTNDTFLRILMGEGRGIWTQDDLVNCPARIMEQILQRFNEPAASAASIDGKDIICYLDFWATSYMFVLRHGCAPPIHVIVEASLDCAYVVDRTQQKAIGTYVQGYLPGKAFPKFSKFPTVGIPGISSHNSGYNKGLLIDSRGSLDLRSVTINQDSSYDEGERALEAIYNPEKGGGDLMISRKRVGTAADLEKERQTNQAVAHLRSSSPAIPLASQHAMDMVVRRMELAEIMEAQRKEPVPLRVNIPTLEIEPTATRKHLEHSTAANSSLPLAEGQRLRAEGEEERKEKRASTGRREHEIGSPSEKNQAHQLKEQLSPTIDSSAAHRKVLLESSLGSAEKKRGIQNLAGKFESTQAKRDKKSFEISKGNNSGQGVQGANKSMHKDGGVQTAMETDSDHLEVVGKQAEGQTYDAYMEEQYSAIEDEYMYFKKRVQAANAVREARLVRLAEERMVKEKKKKRAEEIALEEQQKRVREERERKALEARLRKEKEEREKKEKQERKLMKKEDRNVPDTQLETLTVLSTDVSDDLKVEMPIEGTTETEVIREEAKEIPALSQEAKVPEIEETVFEEEAADVEEVAPEPAVVTTELETPRDVSLQEPQSDPSSPLLPAVAVEMSVEANCEIQTPDSVESIAVPAEVRAVEEGTEKQTVEMNQDVPAKALPAVDHETPALPVYIETEGDGSVPPSSVDAGRAALEPDASKKEPSPSPLPLPEAEMMAAVPQQTPETMPVVDAPAITQEQVDVDTPQEGQGDVPESVNIQEEDIQPRRPSVKPITPSSVLHKRILKGFNFGDDVALDPQNLATHFVKREKSNGGSDEGEWMDDDSEGPVWVSSGSDDETEGTMKSSSKEARRHLKATHKNYPIDVRRLEQLYTMGGNAELMKKAVPLYVQKELPWNAFFEKERREMFGNHPSHPDTKNANESRSDDDEVAEAPALNSHERFGSVYNRKASLVRRQIERSNVPAIPEPSAAQGSKQMTAPYNSSRSPSARRAESDEANFQSTTPEPHGPTGHWRKDRKRRMEAVKSGKLTLLWLQEGQGVRRVVRPNSVEYFAVKVMDPTAIVTITVHTIEGDADVYVSTEAVPTPLDYQFKSSWAAGDDRIVIPPSASLLSSTASDSEMRKGSIEKGRTFYIAVINSRDLALADFIVKCQWRHKVIVQSQEMKTVERLLEKFVNANGGDATPVIPQALVQDEDGAKIAQGETDGQAIAQRNNNAEEFDVDSKSDTVSISSSINSISLVPPSQKTFPAIDTAKATIQRSNLYLPPTPAAVAYKLNMSEIGKKTSVGSSKKADMLTSFPLLRSHQSNTNT